LSSSLNQLVDAINPGARLLQHWPLTGGVSAQTTALKIETSDDEQRRLVLRQHGARDRSRDPDIAAHEFQLLQTLHAAGIPVPLPVFVDPTGDIIGDPGIVVEFIEGDIRTAKEDPPSATELVEMSRCLAEIHSLDLAQNDLSFLKSIDYQAAERLTPLDTDSALLQRICNALQQMHPFPTTNSPALLHGDYWRGNIIWNDTRIAAIIDWEDAMIADPVIDLARARLELAWTWGAECGDRFTRLYLARHPIDTEMLPVWDLVMALTFARALPGWELPEATENEMLEHLEHFATTALGRIKG
jgi:aminoglycoside phosphotransferase (APT) family kinase protein